MGTLPFAMMPPPPPAKRLTAAVDDFTLHADTAVAAHDRDGLERLCRYGARPPFAHRRLRLTPSGQVAYRLRRPWFTGQTEIVRVRSRGRRLGCLGPSSSAASSATTSWSAPAAPGR